MKPEDDSAIAHWPGIDRQKLGEFFSENRRIVIYKCGIKAACQRNRRSLKEFAIA